MSFNQFVGRLLSIVLIIAGLSCLAAGAGAPLLAEEVTCVQGAWIEPAECQAAHVAPAVDDRILGDAGGCKFVGGNCTAQGTGCSATPTFNGARKGTCQAFIGGSEITRCAEDFSKTAVTLSKVVGACDSVNGDCGCRYSAAMPAETMNVEVCNCKQEGV